MQESHVMLSCFFQNTRFVLFLPFLVWFFNSWVIIPEGKYLEEKSGIP